MGDIGEYWRDVKDSHRAMRERQGWISSRYKTEEQRAEMVSHSHQLNARIDDDDLRAIKRLGIDAERKSESSFQLHLNSGNVMLYTGRKGTFIYIPSENKKVNVDRWFDDLKDKVRAIENAHQNKASQLAEGV